MTEPTTGASPRFRSVLDSFPAYQPGRTPVSSAGKSHKLSSNESPYAPLPSVVEVIAEKCRIYAGGLARRGRIDQARLYQRIGDQAQNWRDAEIGCAIKSIRSALHEIQHEC